MQRSLPHGPLAGLTVFIAAIVVRLWWMPTWSRLRFDGHEAQLLAAFQGNPPDASAQAWPLAILLHQGLGLLTQDPRALTVLAALAGALAAVGAARAVSLRWGRWAGIWTGALVAVLPEHAAWSTSAYPVMHAHALLIWAFAVRRETIAAPLLAAACLLRPELTPFALLRGRAGLAGLLGPLQVWWLGAPPAADPLLSLRANLPLWQMLGPPALAAGLIAIRQPTAWVLLVIAVSSHIWGSLFPDYGARHALVGAVALCALVGLAAQRHGGLIAIAVVALMVPHTQDLSQRWLQRTALPPPAASDALPPPPEGCVEVTEEPPIPGQPLPSHFEWLAGTLTAHCVVWGEEAWHQEWSSRGLRDRALRMRSLYQPTPVGVLRPGPGRVRVLHQLARP